MNTKILTLFISLAGMTVLSGCMAGFSTPGVGVYANTSGYIDIDPPSPRYENRGIGQRGKIWIDGYWMWNGGRYQWQPGYWETQRQGYRWAPHRWERDGRGWTHHGGTWERGY